MFTTDDSFDQTAAYFEEDLPSIKYLVQEVQLWKRLWKDNEEKSDTVQRTVGNSYIVTRPRKGRRVVSVRFNRVCAISMASVFSSCG